MNDEDLELWLGVRSIESLSFRLIVDQRCFTLQVLYLLSDDHLFCFLVGGKRVGRDILLFVIRQSMRASFQNTVMSLTHKLKE